MVTALPRQPGQKEERYAHLLSGEPEIPAAIVSSAATPAGGLTARVEALEALVESLQEQIRRIEDKNEA